MVVEQRKTIVNLYNSGINPEIISLELDVSQEEVMRVIESETNEEERKRDAVEKLSDVPLLSKLYLDSVVNIDRAIDHAQSTMWKALKVKSEFDISTEEADKILEPYAESKVSLVILNIDLVESTKLSMILPAANLQQLSEPLLRKFLVNNILRWLRSEICWIRSFAFSIVGPPPASND